MMEPGANMSSGVELRAKGLAPLVAPKPRRMNTHDVIKTIRVGTRPSAEVLNEAFSGPERRDSSGTSTPIPVDAPPSVIATSFARKETRARNKRRLFPTIEYAARFSHFDPRSDHRDFRGFFVLFWVGLAIMVITTVLRNLKETGYPFVFRQRQLLVENIWELALSDLMMAGSTAVSLPLHKLFASSNRWLSWKRGGIWVQSIVQAAWLVYWVDVPFIRHWTWTAQVFFTLHVLVMFMKMHSWAFYNGHLRETKIRLQALDKEDAALPIGAAEKYPSVSTRVHEAEDLQRTTNPTKEEALDQLREDLAFELTSPLGNVTYPKNVTVGNFVDYLFCPTLCYELEYPRTEEIRFMELFWKTLAVFGCIFLLIVTTEEFILPVLDDSALRLQGLHSHAEIGLVLAETISALLFPFMVAFLLVFLVIFEYICGAFAELTCFADRHFYSDWWNSCDWLEFSREWNIPVHNFFHRHVYMASKGLMPRTTATILTFAVSAVAHELVLGCITKKLRGYGAFALLLQIPIVAVQRSQWVRGRTLLNNVIFWCSMISGLAIMCALYVLL